MSKEGFTKVDFDHPWTVLNSLVPSLGSNRQMLKRTEDILKEKTLQLIAINTKTIKDAIADRARGIGVLANPKSNHS